MHYLIGLVRSMPAKYSSVGVCGCAMSANSALHRLKFASWYRFISIPYLLLYDHILKSLDGLPNILVTVLDEWL